jgi:hypothetical protein
VWRIERGELIRRGLRVEHGGAATETALEGPASSDVSQSILHSVEERLARLVSAVQARPTTHRLPENESSDNGPVEPEQGIAHIAQERVSDFGEFDHAGEIFDNVDIASLAQSVDCW